MLETRSSLRRLKLLPLLESPRIQSTYRVTRQKALPLFQRPQFPDPPSQRGRAPYFTCRSSAGENLRKRVAGNGTARIRSAADGQTVEPAAVGKAAPFVTTGSGGGKHRRGDFTHQSASGHCSKSILAPPVRPNPSVEARPNGIALGPRGTEAYHVPRGPSAIPSVPPHLKR